MKSCKSQFLREIGKAGYPLERVLNDIQKQGLQLQKTYRVFENSYHRLFVLRKMGVSAHERLRKYQADC